MATISRSGIAASSTISATHITNIIDALDGIGVTTIVATGSFSGSLKGNLTGTSSWASNATNATTASTATSVPYTNISSIPSAISYYGTADVQDISTSQTASVLGVGGNGRFYSVDATAVSISVLLDISGTSTGAEFTFFAKNLNYPITFRTESASHFIISENGYLSMYGTGSAVTAKMISATTWALIGSLKA